MEKRALHPGDIIVRRNHRTRVPEIRYIVFSSLSEDRVIVIDLRGILSILSRSIVKMWANQGDAWIL